MSGGSILVVEDEPSVGEVVSLYLRRAGYQVTVIQDGQKALASLKNQLPHLVILDLMLPGAGGGGDYILAARTKRYSHHHA